MLGFRFHEVMEGEVERPGETFDRPFRFDVDVRAPSVLGFASTAVGRCKGHVRLDGLAKRAPATGRLELSPFDRRTIGYFLEFPGDDGKTYRFEGKKTIGGVTFTRGWTTLPGEVTNVDGALWGRAVVRFSIRRHLPGLLGSIRLRVRANG